MKETIGLRGCDGRVWVEVPILRRVTLRGIDGFCIHRYQDEEKGIDEYRVSHIETGAYLTKGIHDGEAFVFARRYNKEDLERMIHKTILEIESLKRLQERGKK